MRKSQVTTLAVAVAVTAATTAAALANAQPTLRFVGLRPVAARGTNFLPTELVRVTLRAGALKRVRAVTSSASGTFTVSFGGVREKDRCGVAMSLVAAGAAGDHAVYRLPPRECPVAANH